MEGALTSNTSSTAPVIWFSVNGLARCSKFVGFRYFSTTSCSDHSERIELHSIIKINMDMVSYYTAHSSPILTSPDQTEVRYKSIHPGTLADISSLIQLATGTRC